MLIKPDNISRTSTAVFIPLTILALQLTLADKIPVVGYYTLMDYFFLCCFITSMVCSIQSGLVFALLTSKSRYIYLLMKNRFDLETLIKNDKTHKKDIKKKIRKHTNQVLELDELQETDIDTITATKESEEANNETNDVIKALEIHAKRNNSYKQSLKTKIIDNDLKTEENIIKTIAYNDVTLSLTYKEILIFNEIEKYVKSFDNICRVLFPLIFTILISVIYRHRN